jgi:molecular chaperone HscB
MNYFELFEIPVQLKIDKSTITKKYFELSRQFHPDYFANAGDDVQADVLEKSALLNRAYKTFQNPDETIKYVLQLKNLLEEEEKYQLPPEFLMEVMDINEQLMDADEPAVITNLQSQISQLENDIYEPVKEMVEGYQEDITSEKELLQVKEYYYKKKYLWRIHQQLAGKP